MPFPAPVTAGTGDTDMSGQRDDECGQDGDGRRHVDADRGQARGQGVRHRRHGGEQPSPHGGDLPEQSGNWNGVSRRFRRRAFSGVSGRASDALICSANQH